MNNKNSRKITEIIYFFFKVFMHKKQFIKLYFCGRIKNFIKELSIKINILQFVAFWMSEWNMELMLKVFSCALFLSSCAIQYNSFVVNSEAVSR